MAPAITTAQVSDYFALKDVQPSSDGIKPAVQKLEEQLTLRVPWLLQHAPCLMRAASPLHLLHQKDIEMSCCTGPASHRKQNHTHWIVHPGRLVARFPDARPA